LISLDNSYLLFGITIADSAGPRHNSPGEVSDITPRTGGSGASLLGVVRKSLESFAKTTISGSSSSWSSPESSVTRVKNLGLSGLQRLLNSYLFDRLGSNRGSFCRSSNRGSFCRSSNLLLWLNSNLSVLVIGKDVEEGVFVVGVGLGGSRVGEWVVVTAIVFSVIAVELVVLRHLLRLVSDGLEGGSVVVGD
jgi:hypothetical protein